MKIIDDLEILSIGLINKVNDVYDKEEDNEFCKSW